MLIYLWDCILYLYMDYRTEKLKIKVNLIYYYLEGMQLENFHGCSTFVTAAVKYRQKKIALMYNPS